MENVIAAVERFAAGQHGVVSAEQARRLGLPRPWPIRLADAGRWQRMQRGIYRVTTSGDPAAATVAHAALLFAGGGLRTSGVLGGPGAVALLGLDDRAARSRPQVVLGPDVHRLQPRGLTYRFERLSPSDRTTVEGLSCTSAVRSLIDVSGSATAAELLAMVDGALRRRLLPTEIAGVPAALRLALELGDGASESAFESRVRWELLAAGLPPPVLQHVVTHDGAFVARVDLAWPALRLAVEADGAATHASPEALRSDLRRQNLLVAAGWTVLRFTWADLGRIAHAVAAALRTPRRRAG